MTTEQSCSLTLLIVIAHYKTEVAENTKKLFKKERSSTAPCYNSLKNPKQKPKYFLEKAVHLILLNFGSNHFPSSDKNLTDYKILQNWTQQNDCKYESLGEQSGKAACTKKSSP